MKKADSLQTEDMADIVVKSEETKPPNEEISQIMDKNNLVAPAPIPFSFEKTELVTDKIEKADSVDSKQIFLEDEEAPAKPKNPE